MIKIDGGKGGGQILRTATSLAALENKDIKVKNIRRSRPNPGLKEQHLKGLRAITRACNGEIEGDSKNSREIKFKPGRRINKEIEVKVETAGSVGLILQQMFPLAMKRHIKIKINGGGTYGKWAPPTDYLKLVFLPLINRYGYKGDINVEKEGFYPKGGARVKAEAQKANLKNLYLEEKGDIKKITGVSKATKHLENSNVAERQAESAAREIKKQLDIDPDIEKKYVDSDSPGSGIILKAETEKTIIGADALGEKGKRSEKIGKKVSKNLVKELRNDGTVDVHLADQLIPYMAYAPGKSVIKTREITDHIQTNIEVTEKITDTEFKIKEKKIKTQ